MGVIKEVSFDDKYIKWFSELSNDNVDIAGGKGASLGEMFNNKFPIPPGFVVTAQAFDYFIRNHGLKEKIHSIISGIDMENTVELDQKAKEIRQTILDSEMPDELKSEIIEAYHILGTEKIEEKGVSQDALNILKNAQEPIFVSVRSSATTEDLADASFAGQQDSFLNIKGDNQIVEHVKKCFASLYTSRAVYYRNKKGFTEEQSLLAVVIQKMVDSEKSGVVFSRNPMNLEEDVIVEAVYGLGTGIVSGQIKPDNYVVSRDLKIRDIKVADKKIAIVRTGAGTNEKVRLNAERSNNQVLSNAQILEIADYAVKLENHYNKPQDIEFAVENEKIYIVQSRPITTKAKTKTGSISGNIILEGLGASPGIGVGIVKIINSMENLSKIKKGDVLVTEMTNPDMVVSMQKSAAIVTDEGGLTSHASIVSREMGIPAIVGTGSATSVLKDGMKITVDGYDGKVYEGQVAEASLAEVEPAVEVSKVKLKVLLDLPDFAERAAESRIDSVGLMRLEGIIASTNKHPLQYEKENKLDEYTELLREGIEKIAQYFKSVWIRSSDLRTDEYSSLKGAPEEEINPMLGFHGIRFLLKHPKILRAELEAIRKIAEKYPYKKLGIMFPQIISMEEVIFVKKIFDEFKTPNMEFGVMIETPASVQIIEDICNEVDFVSFGTNDLTQYTLAVDRGEDKVQELYDDLHPAVLSQIKKVIQACKGKVEVSICGQAGSKEKMVEFLLKQGIDSISVNADAAKKISMFIKNLEEKGIEQEEIEPIIEEPKKSEIEENEEEIEPETEEFEEESEIEKSKVEELKIGETEPAVKSTEQEEEIIKEPEEPQKQSVVWRREPPLDAEQRFKRISKYKYEIDCDDCGKKAVVPFKPRKSKKVYCKDCHKNRKQESDLKQDSEPVKSIDDTNRIEKKAEEIKQKVRQDNLDAIEEGRKSEDRIEVEKQEIDNRENEFDGNIDEPEVEDIKAEPDAESSLSEDLKDTKELSSSSDENQIISEDKPTGDDFDLNEQIGIYNPDEEEDKKQKYEYSFEDEEDEVSDVF